MRYFRAMNKRSKIDLQTNRLTQFNRWYLIKVLFYISAIVGLLGYMIYAMNNKEEVKIEEIEGVTIEL